MSYDVFNIKSASRYISLMHMGKYCQCNLYNKLQDNDLLYFDIDSWYFIKYKSP